MRRFVGAVAVLLLVIASPAMAQYSPQLGSLSLDRSALPGGSQLTASSPGGTWSPGSNVAFTAFSTPVSLGSVRAAADGSLSATFTIPASLGLGAHTIQAVGSAPDGSPRTLTAAFTLLSGATTTAGAPAAATATGSAGVLARTGTYAAALTVVAGGLLLVGVLLVRSSRRPAEA